MWTGIVVASVGCYLFKLVGLSVPGSLLSMPTVQRIASVLPLGMLGALTALETFSAGQHLAIDARIAGVGVAAVAVTLRAPFLVVVTLAAVTTALLRALI